MKNGRPRRRRSVARESENLASSRWKVPASRGKAMPKGGKVHPHRSESDNTSGSKPSPTDATLNAIANVERQAYEARSLVDRVAGWITQKAGSGTMIILHVFWFATWLLINLQIVPVIQVFD